MSGPTKPLKKIFQQVAAALFPNRCVFCGSVVTAGAAACPECEKRLPLLTGELCKRCGREKPFCSCRGRHYEFSRCVAPFYYEDVARLGVLRFKYGRRSGSAETFALYAAGVTAREYAGEPFDMVTAVPMSRAEYRSRGFNQSEEFARALAGALGLAFIETLVKVGETKPQHSCDADARWGNIFGAFDVCADVSGKNVLLADDIITTGATLSECAKMLRLAGARDVRCAVIACVRRK